MKKIFLIGALLFSGGVCFAQGTSTGGGQGNGGGSGTVTSVSCVSGCTVTNPTTTPAITVTASGGTVTSIATTSPVTGGTITTTGTIGCASCVTSSSPGAGVAHFAGSTQAVTSSPVSLAADVTGQLPISAVGSAGLSATSPVTIASSGAIACTTCLTSSGVSGMTATQVPIAATATTITSSIPLVGTDAGIATAATISTSAGTAVCSDANGGVTTTGCASGGTPALSAITSPTSTVTPNMAGFGWGLNANIAQTADMFALTGFNGTEAFNGISITQGGTSDSLLPIKIVLKNTASVGETILAAASPAANLQQWLPSTGIVGGGAYIDDNYNMNVQSNVNFIGATGGVMTATNASPILFKFGSGPTTLEQFGGTQFASNTSGAATYISAGRGTGTASLASLCLKGDVKAASGTTAHTQIFRSCSNLQTTLTNATATTFLTVANASGTTAGGLVKYCVHADNGTDFQSSCGEVTYSVVNKAGTTTTNVGTVGLTSSATSSGTITMTFAFSGNALQATNTSTVVTPTNVLMTWSVENFSDANDITVTSN